MASQGRTAKPQQPSQASANGTHPNSIQGAHARAPAPVWRSPTFPQMDPSINGNRIPLGNGGFRREAHFDE